MKCAPTFAIANIGFFYKWIDVNVAGIYPPLLLVAFRIHDGFRFFVLFSYGFRNF